MVWIYRKGTLRSWLKTLEHVVDTTTIPSEIFYPNSSCILFSSLSLIPLGPLLFFFSFFPSYYLAFTQQPLGLFENCLAVAQIPPLVHAFGVRGGWVFLRLVRTGATCNCVFPV